MKYSSCYYEAGAANLDEAETAMLEIYIQRAQLQDGMSILELGCGWGSLCLHLAQRFPRSKITGLSNSNGQREYILAEAKRRGIDSNLTIITADINSFDFDQPTT